jgi:sugar lactone lactonase YvrE
MRSPGRIALVLFSWLALSLIGFAQSGIITTYAGPALPVNGALATTQAIDYPMSVAPDGTGGFYVASTNQNRVYRVTADGRISLAAGTSVPGFSGDGGPATAAQLNRPYSIAVDSAGNLFIADMGNLRVRKVTQAGVINTVAGGGRPGSNGDGGPAIAAQLGGLPAIALDTAGNLFIASDGRVRKVTPDGVINTVAGVERHPGFSGDGGPATSALLSQLRGIAVDKAGDLFIADYGNQRVRKVTAEGIISTVAGNGSRGFNGDGGPATSAELNGPSGLAVDAAGNLFIADFSNNRVRKVTPAGVISTVAGDRPASPSVAGPPNPDRLSTPSGVAVDTVGNLFIADSNGNHVFKMTPDGVIKIVAGIGRLGSGGDGGPATAAQLTSPYGLAIDKAGNLFIADQGNNRIRKVTPAGIISTVAGAGVPASNRNQMVPISNPFGLAIDAEGNLFIAIWNGQCVLKMTPGGEITRVAGNGSRGFSGDGGPATSAQLWAPVGLAVDAAGNLFIADDGNGRIRKVTPDGVISTVAGKGIERFSGDGGSATSARFNSPRMVDAAGNLFVADSDNCRVRKVTLDGIVRTVAGDGTCGFSGDGGPATAAHLGRPLGLAVDAVGNLFIVDSSNNRIRKVTPDGVINAVAGSGTRGYYVDGGPAILAQFNSPSGITVDKSGTLFIADSGNQRIRKMTPDGTISTLAGNGSQGYGGDGGSATSAELSTPSAVAVDTAGNLFIADSNNGRVRKVASNGIISTVSVGGTTGNNGVLSSIAVDSADNLFIADFDHSRVFKVTPSGVASTIAGNGTYGFSGDGGPAASAQLAAPCGVSVDTAGNLFIADTGNNRVRKVTSGGVISTVAGIEIAVFSGDGGPATSAVLYDPTGVALDAAGNLFIADSHNQRIRRVTPDGMINTVAGGGTQDPGDGGLATSARLYDPEGIAVDAAGNLFIADNIADCIRKVTPDGTISTVAGTLLPGRPGQGGFGGDGGPATSALLNRPYAIAVDSAGNLYIADTFNNRVRKVTFTSPAPLPSSRK